METKKALKIVLISTGSLLALLTIVVVALPKIINSANKDKIKETEPVDTGGKPNTTPTETANPIGNVADIKKFQDWMDVKHPNWLDNKTSLNKGFGYGNYGSQTTKAWIKYSTEYLATPSNKPTSTKIYKAYSKMANNVIKTDPNNWITNLSNHLAGNSEYLGDLTGVIKKDFNGVPYLQIKQAGNKMVYAIYNTVKLTM